MTTCSSFSVDTVQLGTTDLRRGASYVLPISLSCLLAVGLAAGIVRLGML
jgi:fluoride ion exporter CrcB/FEX